MIFYLKLNRPLKNILNVIYLMGFLYSLIKHFISLSFLFMFSPQIFLPFLCSNVEGLPEEKKKAGSVSFLLIH